MTDSRKPTPVRSDDLDQFLRKYAIPRDPNAPEPQFTHEDLLEVARSYRRPPDHLPGRAVDLIVPLPGELAQAMGMVMVGSRYWIRGGSNPDVVQKATRTGEDDPRDDLRRILRLM